MKKLIYLILVLFLCLSGCVTDDKGKMIIPQGKCTVCDTLGISKPDPVWSIEQIEPIEPIKK